MIYVVVLASAFAVLSIFGTDTILCRREVKREKSMAIVWIRQSMGGRQALQVREINVSSNVCCEGETGRQSEHKRLPQE